MVILDLFTLNMLPVMEVYKSHEENKSSDNLGLQRLDFAFHVLHPFSFRSFFTSILLASAKC